MGVAIALAAVLIAAAIYYLRSEPPAPEGTPSPFEPFVPAEPFTTVGDPFGFTTPGPTPLSLPGGHNEWDNQIKYAANVNGLPSPAGALAIKAIIEHESAHTWNPEILGDYTPDQCPSVYNKHPYGYRPSRGRVLTAGWCALGLMQIHRFWHPTLASVYDLLDGNENIIAGAQLVADLWRRSGEWERVFAGYNGGPDAARAWPRVSLQVVNYVANVGGTHQRFAAEAGIAV